MPYEGLAEQGRAVARGTVSSRELVERALERIDAASELNAFSCVRREAALAEADAADRRRSAGETAPLLGVPVAIKDDTDLAGEVTAFGCAGEFAPSAHDAAVVRRLREAGAVIIGKTTASEIGQWPITESETFGVTRNPWNTAHTPGGSSGGSAAAVAAGIVAGAVGSDGAGSVRIPAAWCHLVGCKPQRGRISTWPDPDPFQGLTAFGPLTRTVADAALALDVLTGCEDGDVHRPPPPQRSFQEAAGSDPGRLRIALSLRPPFTAFPARLDREIRAAVERLGEGLERLGHHVEPADPFYGPVGVSFLPRSMAGIRDWVQRVPDTSLLDSRTRANAAVGRLLGGPLLRAARAAEGPLRALVGRIFRRYDLILAPTTAAAALPVGAIDGLSGTATDRAIIAACPYAWPWNVLGWPAINVPAGLTSGGLPIGAQLMGPGCSEERLLAVAAQLEAVEDWAERTPPMWTGGPATSTAVGAGSGAAERRL